MIKKRLRAIVKNTIYALPSSGVLMFHHVEDTPALPRSKCLLATERFYEIISAFPAEAYASVSDVLKRKRKIAITFDDGIEDVLIEGGHLLTIIFYDGSQPLDFRIGCFELSVEEDLLFLPQFPKLFVDVTASTQEHILRKIVFASELLQHMLFLQ